MAFFVISTGFHKIIYHFDTSDQRKPQGYIYDHRAISRYHHRAILWLGRCHNIALTTAAFDAEEATKHQFPLIIYIELLKLLYCGFELNMYV